MSKSTACIAPEVLAAFIDGRLSGERRREVVEHLDACEDCYAIFSETVRFQGEEEPRGRVVRTHRFGQRSWIWPAVAAAAVLIVLVATPLVRNGSSRSVVATLPDGTEVVVSAERFVDAMVPPPRGGPEGTAEARPWKRWPDETGLSFGAPPLSGEVAAFRIGVRLIDLEIAADAGDGKGAQEAIAGLRRTIDSAGVLPELGDRLREASNLADEGAFSDLGAHAEQLEGRAQRLLDPLRIAFGEWSEAGRRAAAAGDRAFFSSSGFRAFQAELATVELPDDIAQVLAEIQRRTGPEGGQPAGGDLKELQRLFGRLLLSH